MQIGMGHRRGGRPLKTWIMTVKEDLYDFEITDGHWEDRAAYWAKIHVDGLIISRMSCDDDDADFNNLYHFK